MAQLFGSLEFTVCPLVNQPWFACSKNASIYLESLGLVPIIPSEISSVKVALLSPRSSPNTALLCCPKVGAGLEMGMGSLPGR